MDFQRAKKEVFVVDDQVIDVTPNLTAGDVLRQTGQDPGNTSLVQHTQSGLPKVLRPTDRINPRNGQRFNSQLNAVEG
jgi:hypothetical protein